MRDITMQRRQAEALQRRTDELARSNAELEQFAYVASHDLQEPLRMVASFTQLLAERYGDRLDETAHRWIAFATDGAQRMQALISDLLTLSRVGATPPTRERVNMTHVVTHALTIHDAALREAGGEVIAESLPTVYGDEGQLVQVMQNLIGNAIKFRRDSVPLRIRVTAERRADDWLFRVEDNGIGFDMRYAEQIFAMFKRLHPRSRHPGTGIGLAICRKVIDRHGGRIWAESTPGAGTTFFFTLAHQP
jgi:light-regulated signal transduction histidine kinase (bacteriophytochrome)